MANVTDTFYSAEGSFHGYGSQWLIGAAGESPETFEAVAEVKSITFGEMATATFDRTHLRSPNAHTEIAAALRSSGPFQMRCNWRPTHESQSRAGGGSVAFTSGGLLAIWMSREERDMKIVLSDDDTTEVPFRGFISKFQPGELGPDGGIDLMVEVQPTDGAWHSDLP